MLIVTLRLSVPLHMTSHVIDLFESYRGPVSVLPGCRSVQLYSHFSTPGDFVLIEEWNSPEALYNHIRSDDFRKVLALMDLAAMPLTSVFSRSLPQRVRLGGGAAAEGDG